MDLRRAARAIGLGASALAVGIAVSGGRPRGIDERAFRALNGPGDARVDRAFRAVTELGSIFASVGAAGALAVSGHRRAARRGLAAAGMAWLAGQGMKRLFERPRPYEADRDGTRLLIGPPRASAFPSSHPAVLLAFVDVAGRALGLGRGARAALIGLAGAVGLSRVAVGVHYPADVVGGLLLGRAVAEAFPDAASAGRRVGR
ncbi:MAG: phosphatase PAP2 family protein [Actinomycetota bacterium]|nr:MAG: phosphatase PAP2 family protein [Actinomycetota bacterium]